VPVPGVRPLAIKLLSVAGERGPWVRWTWRALLQQDTSPHTAYARELGASPSVSASPAQRLLPSTQFCAKLLRKPNSQRRAAGLGGVLVNLNLAAP